MFSVEQLDIFDEDGLKVIGQASRREAHEKGLWHQTFHCWIAGSWDDQRVLLCQERSGRKKSHPGLLDISVAGHLLAGEQPLAGVREIQEELGLRVEASRLQFAQRRREAFCLPAMFDNEYAMEYGYVLPALIQPALFQLQAAEVSGLFLAVFQDLVGLFSGQYSEIGMVGWRNQVWGGLQPASRLVKAEDFVRRPPAYYLDWVAWFERHWDAFNSTVPWGGG